jgi:hypothetical protein
MRGRGTFSASLAGDRGHTPYDEIRRRYDHIPSVPPNSDRLADRSPLDQPTVAHEASGGARVRPLRTRSAGSDAPIEFDLGGFGHLSAELAALRGH